MALRSSRGVEPISLSSNPLMRAFDRKAKGYLSSLHRSFSTSAVLSDVSMLAEDDPSAMTVEFLRARLLSQRAEYKAERQRARVLAQMVLELEQKLKLEIHLRRQAESVLTRDDNEDQSTMEGSASNEEVQEGEQNDITSVKDNASTQKTSEGSVELRGDDQLFSGNGTTFSPLPNLRPCNHPACRKLVHEDIRSAFDKVHATEFDPENNEATMRRDPEIIRGVQGQSVCHELPGNQNFATKVRFGSNYEISEEDERTLHLHKDHKLSTLPHCQVCNSPQPGFVSQGRQLGANPQNRTIQAANLSDEAHKVCYLPNENLKREMQTTSASMSLPISAAVSSLEKHPYSNLGSPSKSVDLSDGCQVSSNHASKRKGEIAAMAHLYEAIFKETTKVNPLLARYADYSLMMASDEMTSIEDAWSRMAVSHNENAFQPYYKTVIKKTQPDCVPSSRKESVPTEFPVIQDCQMRNKILELIKRQVECGTDPRNAFKMKTRRKGQLR